MAAPPGKRVVELIDLTSDDDDDGNASPLLQPRTKKEVNGYNNKHFPVSSTQAHSSGSGHQGIAINFQRVTRTPRR